MFQLGANPFLLENTTAWLNWRANKLDDYPEKVEDLIFSVDNHDYNPATLKKLALCIQKSNIGIFELSRPDRFNKQDLQVLARRFGLQHLDHNPYAKEDAITSLCEARRPAEKGYIPYTNKALNWHTDGYYNTPEKRVQGMILYCVQAADTGGENTLLDPEIVYLLLRDHNPEYISALMADDVLTIPPNIEGNKQLRAAVQGPVFSIHPVKGTLHMRFTIRAKHIQWKQDSLTREALEYLHFLLNTPQKYHFRVKLSKGQGLLNNNVLHKREAFTDSSQNPNPRLLYRARYHERIQFST